MQRAFIEEQAAQCGYCIAGMMMRAQALLQKRPDANDAEIRAHMEPNLCRCGTHMRILKAVRRAADLMRDRSQAKRFGKQDMTQHLSPRDDGVLAGTGALLVSFSLSRDALAQQGEVQGAKAAAGPKLPGALGEQPMLDAWIRIDASGAATVFTGKAELGQGIRTALLQVAADELALSPKQITLVTADTARTANEGYTSGSLSMQNSATAIRHAAAQARELLVAEAARRLALANRTICAPTRARCRRRMVVNLATETSCPTRCCTCRHRPPAVFGPAAEQRYIGPCFHSASTSRPRLRAAKRTSKIASLPGCCMPALCARRSRARASSMSIPGRSSDCRALPRSCATGISWLWSHVASGRPSRPCGLWQLRARWIAPQSLPNPSDLMRVLETSVAQTGVVADMGSETPSRPLL